MLEPENMGMDTKIEFLCGLAVKILTNNGQIGSHFEIQDGSKNTFLKKWHKWTSYSFTYI